MTNTNADLVWRIMVGTLKGGSTKTTTSMGLAFYLAMQGLRVLLICADARHRGATKWVRRVMNTGAELPFVFERWDESQGPLSAFARQQEQAHDAQVVIIDSGNEKETFTHGCLYSQWLVSPVAPNEGELDGIPDTYMFAESVRAITNNLDMRVLLTRSPSPRKGVALTKRLELESAPDEIDPMKPWTLGLNVLDAEISRNLEYSAMYGTVPGDVLEYKKVAIELLRLRAARSKQEAAV